MEPTSATLKQPRVLYLLFFTELWERFGFYTVQTIIMLYMTKALGMTDQKANMLYAAFSSLLYLTPIVGGYLADRYLGFQRAINIGGLLFVVAYVVTSFRSESMFFLGLSILICANGFFKPNVSSIVGELYGKDDPRRDGGFTLFYMGINVGAIIPPLIAGSLVTHYGWHAGFLLAAVGMVLGQITFLFGKKYLGEKGLQPKRLIGPKPGLGFYFVLIVGTLAVIEACRVAFQYPNSVNYIIELAALIMVFVLIYFLSKESLEQRKKMFACLILIIISIVFWALYNQAFTSLMLYADRNMEKHFLGMSFDAENSQFFNSFFIITLSPFLSRLWIRMDTGGLNPSTQSKFALSILFMSLGYFFLAFGTMYFNTDGMSSPWWLCGSYLLQTIGELLISPIGLAMITVLCPKNLTSMMMGVWFFSQAASFPIEGMLANLAAVPDKLSPAASLPYYTHAFLIYGTISLVTAAVSFTLIPFLTKLTKSNA